MSNKPQWMLLSLLVALTASAKVRLPHMIGDNMIIQQNTKVHLWGWDQPGRTIAIQTSWQKDPVRVTTGKEDRWSTFVTSPEAGFTPLSITFDDGEPTTVSNVLSGEIWVCAGQSNMKMPVDGYDSSPVEGSNLTIAEAANVRGIHYLDIPRVKSATPLNDCTGQWKVISPATVGQCSAVGYYFARLINRTLHIPVGLIAANQGGTRVESWMSKEYLLKYTQESTDSATIVRHQSNPGRQQMLWYNGTFHPILDYTVKGILFYQGCSNVGDPGDQYSERLALLARQWREGFRQGNLPFYFVEIAPFATRDMNGIQSALLREQQYRALSLIPNSRIVGTNDLAYPWERNQIHPCQKRPIGERLAFIALHENYGMDKIVYENPCYKKLAVSNDTCYVEVESHAFGMNRFDDIEGFEVAGADRVFYPAKATFDRKKSTAVVISDRVKSPVAVRYCFRNFQTGNFKNQGGLPLLPFRTDRW